LTQTNPLQMNIYGYDVETTGLMPHSAEIVTIQYKRESSDPTVYKRWEYSSEKEILLDFLNDWKNFKRARTRGAGLFVGYNILKFDAPFLHSKARQHNIASEKGWNQDYVWQNLVHGPAFVDMNQLLGDDMKKFAEWRNCLTGRYGDFESKDIPDFYRNQQYEKIEEYVNDEMITLEKVWNEIQQEDFYQELQNLRETASAKWEARKSSSLSDF